MQIAFSERVPYRQVSEAVGKYIFSAGGPGNLSGKERYTFGLPHPKEEGHWYLPGKIYSVSIRAVSESFMKYLEKKLAWHSTALIQGLSAELRSLPRMQIYRIYSMTPAVFLTDNGYWRSSDSRYNISKVLTDDLIRKYNFTHASRLNAKISLVKSIRIENRRPVQVNVRGRMLFGDRLDILPETDPAAQEVFYTALGMGLGNYTEYGWGYLGFRPFHEWG